ncbi:MAG: hypothetical protein PHS82_16220 [Lachnospiraceae bacterium]|nr:hypothetical protein [Lachnospiraceae bacterium]
MLGKLMKHQTKSVYRILLIIHAAVILLAVLGGIFNALSGSMVHSSIFNTIIGFLLFFYVMTLIFVFFATHFIMISRFYKSMYTDEGYLTHTLPVKPWQLLVSNTLVYLIVCILDVIILLGSLFMWALPNLQFKLNVNGISYVMDSFGKGLQTIAEFFDISVPALIVIAIVLVLISLLYFIGSFYFSLSVGSLFAPHKVVASVITYIVLYIITQIVSLVALVVSPATHKLLTMQSMHSEELSTISDFAGSLFTMGLVITVIVSILYYGVTHFILSRKLNLE